MKPFFSESDCDRISYEYSNIVHKQQAERIQVPCFSLDTANRLISERAKVVSCRYNDLGLIQALQSSNGVPFIYDTHQALLICVEEIEKDSAEKFVSDFAHELETNVPFFFQKWADRAKRLLEK